MDELTDMWTESKSDFDDALDFPEWWERDLEAMVRKDFNHPSVVFYSIGNEIPEVGAAARRGVVPTAGREGPRAGRHRLRHERHQRDARRDRRGRRRPDGVRERGRHQHDADRSSASSWTQLSASELVAARTAEAFGVLDAAGMNYMEARYEIRP